MVKVNKLAIEAVDSGINLDVDGAPEGIHIEYSILPEVIAAMVAEAVAGQKDHLEVKDETPPCKGFEIPPAPSWDRMPGVQAEAAESRERIAVEIAGARVVLEEHEEKGDEICLTVVESGKTIRMSPLAAEIVASALLLVLQAYER